MKKLFLVARRWFNRRAGATYHSVEISIDDKEVARLPLVYGYDQQWEQTAIKWLEGNGYLKDRKRTCGTPGEAIWRYCERLGILYNYSVTDVQRKKDL